MARLVFAVARLGFSISQIDLKGGNKTAIAAVLGLWGGAVTSASLVNAYELGV